MSLSPSMYGAFPTRPDDVKASWLNSVLRDQGVIHKSILVSVEVDAATANHSIIGEVARLKLSYDRDESDAPQSVIAKFPTQHQPRRAYFSSLGMYAREVSFYQQLADHVALRIPHCYFAAWDARHEQGILLLEDLAPAQAGNRIVGCTVEQAEQVVHQIARLHIDWWENPLLATYDWLGTIDLTFFHERYRQSWQALRAKPSQQLPVSVLALGQRLAERPDILTPLWQPPLTLIHRDLQLDNIFFVEGQPPIIIDWQLIARGRGVFDVANFLCWNLDPSIRHEHEMRILRQYHERLVAGAIMNYDWQECFDDYRLSIVESFARVVAILGQNLVEDQSLLAVLETLLSRTSRALVELEVNLSD